MAKKFNYTGTCIPGKHYMVDTSQQIAEIMALVVEGVYFTINRPRQYGKTTTLLLLERELAKKDYLPISISFEGIGDTPFANEANFCSTFISLIKNSFHFTDQKLYEYFSGKKGKAGNLDALSVLISKIVLELKKEVVLFIDEVDKSSNNQLFLHFIGMLRDKYLLRNSGKDFTFHSVVLAGVHDIKSIKLKLRPGEEAKYNSPWNIAVDFKVDMSFSAEGIATMLRDYAEEREVAMDIPLISAKLRYYTSGYPFLVSKLCYIIDSEVMKENRWLPEDVDRGVALFLREKNTNFDSLIKNLENNRDLSLLVEKILMENARINYTEDNALISLGATYGIFRDEGTVAIHNRIYYERIMNYMAVNLQIESLLDKNINNYNFQDSFINTDGSLNFERVLLKFQLFMKEQYSEKDNPFLERNGRLIFLSFLKPIINGKGYDYKEPQISEEKRLDVVVTFGIYRYIVELKIWDGPQKHQAGISQLAGYLDRQNSQSGYLIIFNFKQKKEWKQERLQADGKDIFVVWV